MGLGIRERVQTGEKFLRGDFTRAIPRIPKLGVRLLKSVATADDDSGYAKAACCRLGRFYSSMTAKVDYVEAER